MILGAQPRRRPVPDPDLRAVGPVAVDPRDHRDRGRFLTPRLYADAAFDPWEPVRVRAEAVPA